MQGVAEVTQSGSPVPRYCLQRTTGRWRKEVTRTGTATGPRTTVDVGGPNDDTTTRCADHSFVSTFDYFLQHVHGIRHADAAVTRKAKQRRETFDDIDAFSRRRSPFKRIHVVEKERSDSDSDVATVLDSSCASVEDSVFDKNEVDRTGRLTQLAVGEGWTNPLMGFLVCVPLYDVHDALVSIKGAAAVHNLHGLPHRDTHLTCTEFHAFLANVGPVALLSNGMERRMFRSLPGYHHGLAVVSVFDLFNFVIISSHHPRLDRTVRALFRAFDLDHKGQLPAEVLHHRVVSAWAETYTYGQLRRQWIELAEALSRAVPCCARGMSGEERVCWPELLDRKTVRAYLCSSAQLYHAANTIDIYRDDAI